WRTRLSGERGPQPGRHDRSAQPVRGARGGSLRAGAMVSRRLAVWSKAVAFTGAVLLPRPLSGAGESMTVIAASSSRPADCRQAPYLWRRATGRGAVSYCDLLLAASARLEEAPQKAQEFAQRAARLEPGRPEPWVLIGRALVVRGRFAEAAQHFAKAEKRD